MIVNYKKMPTTERSELHVVRTGKLQSFACIQIDHEFKAYDERLSDQNPVFYILSSLTNESKDSQLCVQYWVITSRSIHQFRQSSSSVQELSGSIPVPTKAHTVHPCSQWTEGIDHSAFVPPLRNDKLFILSNDFDKGSVC